jgi:hypothetical protein
VFEILVRAFVILPFGLPKSVLSTKAPMKAPMKAMIKEFVSVAQLQSKENGFSYYLVSKTSTSFGFFFSPYLHLLHTHF